MLGQIEFLKGLGTRQVGRRVALDDLKTIATGLFLALELS